MTETIHLLNGRVVNEGIQQEAHLILRDGRIERICSAVPSSRADRVIDVAGAWVLPGLIDDQVHFREPGFPKKGTIRTESMAAVAGGVTSYMEMPNTYPPTTDAERLDEKHVVASRDSYANYSFYLGGSNTNLDAVRAVDGKRVPGIKVFMGSSTGNMRVSEPEVLERIFQHAPIPVVTHCEDDDIIAANLERYKAVWGEEIPARYHPDIRSREACLASSKLAIELARRHDADLHILHLTTAEELAMFEPGPIDGKKITAEACVHHLHFNDSHYAALGHRLKCNPAVKTEQDRLAIIEALKDGRIDILATDHAPHELEYKSNPYTQAPSGLPLVQHVLQVLWEHVRRGELTVERLVEATSHAVAKRFSIKDRGFLREGYWADIVVVREHEYPVKSENHPLYSRCGWSPFEAESFYANIEYTLVSGHLVAENGRVVGDPRGLALEYLR
ncbi:MAG: dihydroorotase [Puniceicoccaceae bacterium]